MPGGYCLDDGSALEKVCDGVWRCPSCGRRAPAVSDASAAAFDGVSDSVVCDVDGRVMTPVRRDVWQCPTCRRRRGMGPVRDEAAGDLWRFGDFRQVRVDGMVTAIAATPLGSVLAMCHGGQVFGASASPSILDGLRPWRMLGPLPIGAGSTLAWLDDGKWVAGDDCGHVLRTLVGGTDSLRVDGPDVPARSAAVCRDQDGSLLVLEQRGASAQVRVLGRNGRQEATVHLDGVRGPAALSLSALPRGSDFVVADRASGQVGWFSRRGSALWHAPASNGEPRLSGVCGLWRRPDDEETFAVCRNDRTLIILDAVGMEIQRQPLAFTPSVLTVTDRFVVFGDEQESAVWVASLTRGRPAVRAAGCKETTATLKA